MNKPFIVISAPINTYSGYGARSRDIVTALINTNKYEIKIASQYWGNCAHGFLSSNIPEQKAIIDCILESPQLPRQPDIWIQVTVPNEFQPIGKYNIGITAGIETNICDVTWIEGINRMDLTLVSSNFAKKVFEDVVYEQVDEQNQIKKTIRIEKPIETLFEGINTNVYKKIDKLRPSEVTEIIDTIEEKFCFLFVGHWMQGDIGQDRKDVGMLIKTFLETFKDKPKKPALILKTNGATFSTIDKNTILDKIEKVKSLVKGDLPKIYLLHGELTDEEMNELYNHSKIKTMVSFTKGEGYGRPLLEFTTSQKPVIASNYSGQLDFLKPELNVLLGGSLTKIHPSAVVQNMLLADSQWFTVDYPKASKQLEEVFKKYNSFLGNAKKQSYLSKTEFSLEKMQELLIEKLDKKVPKVVEFKLPKLQKVQ